MGSLKRFRVMIKTPTLSEIKYQLINGWYIFMSTIAVSLYTISNTFILGLFTNNTIVGYYSAGEKIVKAFRRLIDPVSQTIYPYISKLASESKDATLSFIRKIVKIVGIPTFLISIVLLIFAPQISNIILGEQFNQSIPVIQILSFLPFLIGLSNIFAVQVMLNFGFKESFSKIFIIASIVNIALALILVQYLQHLGIALSWLITEILVTCLSFLFIQFHGLKVIWSKSY